MSVEILTKPITKSKLEKAKYIVNTLIITKYNIKTGNLNATVLVSKMQYSGFGTLKDMKRGIQLQFFNKMER